MKPGRKARLFDPKDLRFGRDRGEKITKTTLRVPRSVWTGARIRALEEGISVQELVVRAINEYVKKGGRR
jgi:hypothetical protein